MLEKIGDIFKQSDADAICFTSNGVVKANGELVMGAGIAKAFKDRWPTLPARFGARIRAFGNIPLIVYTPDETCIISFPTKYHWKDKSDLNLIKQSAEKLAQHADDFHLDFKRIYLPRPGCGLGGLDWETQVKPLISSILDDRFVVISNE